MSSSYEAAGTASTTSFVAALISNSAIAGAEFAAFLVLRGFIKAIYEPRTYIPPKELQAPVLGKHRANLWKPIWTILQSDPEEILQKTGVDPYVFVRFLAMMAKAMIPIWLVSWVVLLPVNSVNMPGATKEGLDRFTFGNISLTQTNRYWAHLILDYVFIFWIMHLMWVEMKHWLVIRQRHLISPAHSKLPQANTVLITDMPKSYLDEDKLEQLFSRLPGGVKRIWLNRNLKEMPDLYSRRVFATRKLESAENELIKLAQKHRDSTQAEIAKLEQRGKQVPDSLRGPVNPQLLRQSEDQTDLPADASQLSRADQLVPRGKRPTYRIKPKWAPFGLGWLGIGRKVDAIEWARQEIADCSVGLEKGREQLRRDVSNGSAEEDYYPPLNSAFIHFNQQIAAHMAGQILLHHHPYRMGKSYVEIAPPNVIWRNLSMNTYEQNIRRAISYGATFGLILLWTFPVAFIGALSNANKLIEEYPWMGWLAGDSSGKTVLRGVVNGLLPPILLALLMLLLPTILRQLAAFEGIPSKTGVELDVMTRYFIFLVIHTFFVVTLSSGLISSLPGLANDPASIATILAKYMPDASNFFITLVLTQFTGTMGTLLQPITLAFYYIKVILQGGSPRSVYTSRYQLQTTMWGTQFPGVTVYAVIMLAYMIISPIINGFGACFFLLSYVIFKYLYIWVYDQPAASDTGGLFFPKAITHVFVGMYIQEVCLCALFFLVRNEQGNASAIPQGALMVVLIVITAAVHYTLHESYKPLIQSLPLSLAYLSYGSAEEKGHDNSQIGESPRASQDVDPDLRDRNRPSSSFASRTSSPDKPLVTEKSSMQQRESQSTNDTRPSHAPKGSITGIPTAPGPPLTTASPVNPPRFGPTGGDQSPNGVELAPAIRLREEVAIAEGDAGKAEEQEAAQYFAVPGGPGIQRRVEMDGNDPDAFFHPATKEPQRILWLPKDELGLCAAEIEENGRVGVWASSRNAWLTHKGKVQISSGPPDDQ